MFRHLSKEELLKVIHGAKSSKRAYKRRLKPQEPRRRIEEELRLFVPALALQHPDNPEYLDTVGKIRLAVLRYYIADDFFDLYALEGPCPGVLVKHCKFNPEALGYEVQAIVKSG